MRKGMISLAVCCLLIVGCTYDPSDYEQTREADNKAHDAQGY